MAIRDRVRVADNIEVDAEIDQSVYMAGRGFAVAFFSHARDYYLAPCHKAMFPSKRVSGFNPDSDDQSKVRADET